MDEHGSAGTADRPLTRRELRAREADGQPPADGEDVPDAGDVEGEPGAVPWRDVVDWSLHQTLPRELPPEPDVDDVRWDAVPQPGARPGDRTPGDPVRVSVFPAQSDGARSAPARPAPDVPAVEDPRNEAHGHDTQSHDAQSHDAPTPDAHTPDDVRTADDTTGPTPWSALLHGEQAPVPAPGVGAAEPAVEDLPTLDDLLARRPEAPAGPAETGWRGAVRRASGGLVAPGPGRAEREHRDAVRRVQRSLDGPKTIVVINPKGGAHKTTAALMLAATFGLQRGGYTLAWDNNETRGTLGWRSQRSVHSNTAVNLLQDLDRFADPGSSRVGDLDNYVRSQGATQFDVLASDEDAASAASIDAFAFRSLHRTLSRFYRVMVVDTGNNMRASNWQAALEAADQVVIVSTVREDTSQSAAWAVDALRATGHGDAVRRAVTVLSAPAPRRDDRLAARLHDHFGALTRAVLDVPYDPALVDGRPLEYASLAPATREAWLRVTATVADGL